MVVDHGRRAEQAGQSMSSIFRERVIVMLYLYRFRFVTSRVVHEMLFAHPTPASAAGAERPSAACRVRPLSRPPSRSLGSHRDGLSDGKQSEGSAREVTLEFWTPRSHRGSTPLTPL